MKLFTLGVYGKTPETFFDALAASKIDTFCDVRSRRGVRGHVYSFANSAALQRRLAEMGIRYFHLRDLAPSDAIRAQQMQHDAQLGTSIRRRETLSDAFRAAYERECLSRLDSSAFVRRLGASAERVVLCCVEGSHSACHRSLLADALARELTTSVTHL